MASFTADSYLNQLQYSKQTQYTTERFNNYILGSLITVLSIYAIYRYSILREIETEYQKWGYPLKEGMAPYAKFTDTPQKILNPTICDTKCCMRTNEPLPPHLEAIVGRPVCRNTCTGERGCLCSVKASKASKAPN